MGKHLMTYNELKDLCQYMIDLNDPKFQASIDEITAELAIIKVCSNGKTLKDLISAQ